MPEGHQPERHRAQVSRIARQSRYSGGIYWQWNSKAFRSPDCTAFKLERANPRDQPSRLYMTDLTLDPPDATRNQAGVALFDEDYLILSNLYSAKRRNCAPCLCSLLSMLSFHRISALACPLDRRRPCLHHSVSLQAVSGRTGIAISCSGKPVLEVPN